MTRNKEWPAAALTNAHIRCFLLSHQNQLLMSHIDLSAGLYLNFSHTRVNEAFSTGQPQVLAVCAARLGVERWGRPHTVVLD